jgi:hypothetical protein
MLKRHVLIVFGGIGDIETAIEADEKLRAKNLKDIFNVICQASGNSKNLNDEFGSRQIRLEVYLKIRTLYSKPIQRYESD